MISLPRKTTTVKVNNSKDGLSCVASVYVGFQSKTRPKNGIFDVLVARKMGRLKHVKFRSSAFFSSETPRKRLLRRIGTDSLVQKAVHRRFCEQERKLFFYTGLKIYKFLSVNRQLIRATSEELKEDRLASFQNTSRSLLLQLLLSVSCGGKGGGTGGGRSGEKGWEVYGRREKRAREAGFPKWREVGEKGKNYATLRNILQWKKCKGAGAKKYRAGTGIKGYGRRKV